MKIDTLTSTSAFVVTDLDDAAQSVGVVRVAPKVLQGSTVALARTATYLFASRELRIGGASAGISATPDQRDQAIASFVEEVATRSGAGELVLDPGPGLDPSLFAALAASDPRDPVHRVEVDGLSLGDHLAALGPVIAADAALDGLDGRTAVVEAGPGANRLVRELAARGAKVVAFGDAKGVAHDPAGLDTDTLATTGAASDLGVELSPGDSLLTTNCAALFCGSRQGMIDGDVAALLGAGVVVPTGCQPVSAKGLAVLRRLEIVALADFVTTAGQSYAGWPETTADLDSVIAAATEGITAMVTETLDHAEGALLGACYRAEAFLATWQDTLPFGRPLA